MSNRTIKFRGKRVNNNEWVYGCYVQAHGTHWIHPADTLARVVEVHPDTVGQFTGLKDKNGTEIYEGDIVQGSYQKPYPIVFDDGAFGYMGEECFLDMDFERHMEVIGTIHDKNKQ